jgi:outer membrane protein
MKQVAHRLFPLLLLLLLATAIHAADPVSFGYVDMQAVIDNSKMGMQALQALKKEFAPRQEELSQEEQSIHQLQQTLARDGALMSQAELDKKTTEIQRRIQAFQRRFARAQGDLAQEEKKLGGRILVPAQAIITELAKDKQIKIVFERRSGLLYVDDSLDLTAEVIERLDAQVKD